MEQAVKIFIIIGMIAGACAIFPLVLGWIALNKMKEGPLSTGWKIVVLLFVSMIAGILLLCMKDDSTPNNPAM
ncbi:MAG: hypothetical protein IJ389_05765 [Clostridia bacterium]|nr:hypothetical protein [Clostridia bacterium]